MKTLKKSVAVFFVSIFIFNGIVSAKSKQKEVRSISLSSQEMNLYVKQSRVLSVNKVKPAKASDKVIWKSSNDKIAKVSGKGKVTALKKGKAVITAISKTNKKVRAKCKIRVKDFKEKAFVTNKGGMEFFDAFLDYVPVKNLVFKDEDNIRTAFIIKTKKELDSFFEQSDYADDVIQKIRGKYDKAYFENDCLLIYGAFLRSYSTVNSVSAGYNIIQQDNGKVNLLVDIAEERPETRDGEIIIDDFVGSMICCPLSVSDAESIDCITVKSEMEKSVLKKY